MAACVYFVGKTCDSSPTDVHCTACLLFLKVCKVEYDRRALAPIRTAGPQ